MTRQNAALIFVPSSTRMALYAFDGTWNREEIDDERDTNVSRFLAAYAEPGIEHLYVQGVGTKLGWLGKVVGGVTGAGTRNGR